MGYRGLNDYPFWTDEPSFNTSRSRGALISKAMAHQAALVRATPGREGDECVTYVWAEARAGKGCDIGQLQRFLSRSFSTRFG